jgi:aspartyl-tRNA(Asn)/glutamyl-tRNA(Gln) amidotransferase subunit A
MMRDDDAALLTIRAQAGLIEARKLSALELTQFCLSRIERLDDRLHAFNLVLREEALAAAREADAEIAAGGYRGPMHGIPIAAKDQMNIRGAPNTAGSRVYRDNVAAEDATLIRRLRQAGAIILGTLATHEFHMGTTLRFLREYPANPWDLSRTPGGSSAGSGSSVAAGLVSGALGGDTGGSIRGPAGFNNIAGLRPTWSLLSRHGIFALAWSMDTAGPLARSAEDCAIMLQAMAGYDPKDPTTSRAPVRSYTGKLDEGVSGIRIGVVEEMLIDIEDATRKAVDDALTVLKSLGAVVERVRIPLVPRIRAVHTAIVDSEAASYHRGKLLEGRYDDYDYNTRVRLMVGTLLPSALTTLAMRARAALAAQVLDTFGRYDILVGPTNVGGATPIPTETGIRSKEDAARRLLWSATSGGAGTAATARNTFSLTGNPAISIPCGFDAKGLPLGMQLAARPFDEPTLFQVCHAYQKATDWHRRHPPMPWANSGEASA